MILSIRPAGPDDLETLRLLLSETWHATYDDFYGPEEVARLTADWHSIEAMERRLQRSKSLFLVARKHGTIVGMLFAAEEQPGTLFLHQLYVLPDEQGAGAGSALIAAAEDAARHVDRIRLDVEIANGRAVGFYQKRGFVALGLEAETEEPKLMRMERLVAGRGRDGHSRGGTP